MLLRMKEDPMMKTLNYRNFLKKVRLIKVELFDGRVFFAEMIDRNCMGYEFKLIDKTPPEYIIINEDAIKSLEDLGFV